MTGRRGPWRAGSAAAKLFRGGARVDSPVPRSRDADRSARLPRALRALEEHRELGAVATVHCDRCDGLLSVTPLGDEAWRMSCDCGRYDDTLRGL